MILQHAIRTLQFSIVYVAFLFISVSLNGQQTGEVSYEQLGVSFSIPEGWVGQETGDVFVLGSTETPGLIILIPHDQSYSLDDLHNEALQGLNLGGGTTLQPVDKVRKNDKDLVMGAFQGSIEYSPAKAFIVAKVNPHGNGVSIVATTTPELYTEETYEELAMEVANSFQFSQVKVNTANSGSSTSSIEDWKYQLGGTRLTYMESYNSGGVDGGGYNMATEIHLCTEGFFKYKDQSFMSAGGFNRTAVSSHNTRGHGNWEIKQSAVPQLILSFHDGSTKYFDLEWREDTKLFMNGYRYFRTWDGEYAPDCSF